MKGGVYRMLTAVLIGGFSISENLGYFLHLRSMVRPVVKAIG